MGEFDNFSGGFEVRGAMYDHSGELKWHSASKTYDILSSVPAGGPAAHAITHQNGGADEILVTGMSGLLADAQTPLTHNILSAHNGFPGGGTTFLRDDGAFAAPPGGGISDGDKGDITVSASGATWTIDADVVSAFARTFLDDVDAATVRATIGAGTSSFNGAYGSLSGIPATFAPSAHATSHQNGGSDEISVAGLSGLLADAQTALAHAASHQNGGGDELNVGGLNGVLADPQPPIIGAGGTQAVAGNDARLADARTPTAHATSHINGGSDELNVAGLNGLLADGQTPLVHDIITGHNGFPGGTSTYLRADGTFATVSAAAGDFDSVLTAASTISTNKTRTIGGRLAINDGGGSLTIEDGGSLALV